MTHENEGVEEFKGYNDETPLSSDLIAREPYAELYVLYLIAKIDYYNGEYAQYNNSAAMYNNKYNEYVSWYNSKNMPLQKNSLRRG